MRNPATRHNASSRSTPAGAASNSLRAEAPEFVPLQARISASPRNLPPRPPNTRPSNLPPRPPVTSHEQNAQCTHHASDIMTRIHKDIAKAIYECAICTNDIGPRSRIWCCRTCWTVFHLGCIKKWSSNEGATIANVPGAARQWRCPGCNLPKSATPDSYTCWCEKETDPQSLTGLPPHSCGQTCGKPKTQKCPHPCDLTCHAGPCPPCLKMGPTQKCFCGRQTTTRKCRDTDYEKAWSCNQVCGRKMACGEHTCPRTCHEGSCGQCEVQLDVRCYCGKSEKTMGCHLRAAKQSVQHSLQSRTGQFQCAEQCQRSFDCGKHQCKQPCHPQDEVSAHCPLSPDIVVHCKCGKTALADILTHPRRTCSEPIPSCAKICAQSLPCGHSCEQLCHDGQCAPCFRTSEITCRCGRTRMSSICHQGSVEQPLCMRSCKAALGCGRHMCGERCCAGERRAAERQLLKRKIKPLGAARIDEDIEAEHICTRICGRPLKCGIHDCSNLCHKGPCATCPEAIFEDVSCHCGKTVLQPPLPCGTRAPPCRFDCERRPSCGHPPVPHNCHGDDERCPKCPFLCQKACLCGKKTLKNQPCFLTEARCGQVCGRILGCGSHTCRLQCHRPGQCEDAQKACKQACGKAKKVCGHACDEPCHAPASCKEAKPCQSKLFITCECQHLRQEVRCLACSTSQGNHSKRLPCNDECARLARNKCLAEALDIDPATHQDDHVPYSPRTINMYRAYAAVAMAHEKQFRVFAADDEQKRLRFKPMPSHQRQFLHLLADDFGFESESMDPEPHRHVAIFKTPRFVKAPMKTLAQSLQIREQATQALGPSKDSNGVSGPATDSVETRREPLYNAFVLDQPRFGLIADELLEAIKTIDSLSTMSVADILFLAEDQVVIQFSKKAMSTAQTMSNTKVSLQSLLESHQLGRTVQLCSVGPSTKPNIRPLDILHCESDQPSKSGPAGGTEAGWSQIVAGASAKRAAARANSTTPWSQSHGRYTVLGMATRNRGKIEVRRQREEPTPQVVGNWEQAVPHEQKDAQANEAEHYVEELESQDDKT